MNASIGLSVEEARRLSVDGARPLVEAPLSLLVGEKESPEFHRQSAALAAAWAGICRAPVSVRGRHHFDVVEELARTGTPVFEEAARLLK